jgi:hypothetical protein
MYRVDFLARKMRTANTSGTAASVPNYLKINHLLSHGRENIEPYK